MRPQAEQIRLLTTNDIVSLERLLRTSEYIYQRFTVEELPLLLQHYPTVGLFHRNTLQAFSFHKASTPLRHGLVALASVGRRAKTILTFSTD